jgi:hypothetical protein
LELGGESSLSLSAGAEIGFSAGLNASAGLGVTVGLEAGVSASTGASFGLEASAGLSAVAGVGVGAELASGFALSAGGGVSAAIESVQTVKNYAAEQQTREAFNAPPKPSPGGPITQGASSSVAPIAQGAPSSAAPIARGAAPPMQPAPPEQNRQPLKNTGLPSISAQQAVGPAPRPPRADSRASSFGFGAPLRPTVGAAADERANSINGAVAVKSKFASGEPPMTDDPTTPPWVALPARDRSRKVADKINRPPRPCGCGGKCKH